MNNVVSIKKGQAALRKHVDRSKAAKYDELQAAYDNLFKTCTSQAELLHAIVLRHGRQVFDLQTMEANCSTTGAHAYIEHGRVVLELKCEPKVT